MMRLTSGSHAAARAAAVTLIAAAIISACATASDPTALAPGGSASAVPATDVALPAATPGSGPATPKPTQAPKPKNLVRIPASIDATGAQDVSAELQQFVKDVPNGSTIRFKAGGTYRLERVIRVSDKRNLTFEGNGATLKLTGPCKYWCGGLYIDQGSAGTTVRDLNIVGNHSAAGTKDACCSREGQHGIAVHGVKDTLIERVDIRRVGGDCFNVKTWYDQPDWAEGVTIRDSSCRLTGRMGVVINGASNVRIVDNVFDDLGYAVFAMEPNKGNEGSRDVVIRNNTVGTYSLNDTYLGYFFYACDAPWAEDPSTISDVTVTGNTVEGNPNGYNGAVRGLHVKVCGDRGKRENFVVTDNTASMPAAGPVMNFTEVDGVTVTGNTQPLASGQLATFPGSTSVTYEGNDT